MKSLITHPEADTVTGLFGYSTKNDVPEDNMELYVLLTIGLALNAVDDKTLGAIIMVLHAVVSDKITNIVSLLQYMETCSTSKQQALVVALHTIITLQGK